jgi:hypothetical protein
MYSSFPEEAKVLVLLTTRTGLQMEHDNQLKPRGATVFGSFLKKSKTR